MRALVAAAVAVAVAGPACARDVRATLPNPYPPDAPGALVLVLTRPSPDVYVAVDGVLVVEGEHTSRIRVDGITPGYVEVAIAIGPAEKQLKVWVDGGRDTVVPVASPGGSALDSVKSMVMSIAAIAVYAWIR